MNRRSFLANLLAGAAAIVGAGMAAPKVIEASIPRSDLWFSDSAIQHGDGPSGWYTDLDDGSRHYLVDGVHQGGCCTPTFEAMVADCAERGCRLEYRSQPFDGPAVPTHTQSSGPTGENADERQFYAAGAPFTVVDAWRISLHDQADASSDARAEGYNRGYDVATARAESRVAEGLPITPGARLNEYARWIKVTDILSPNTVNWTLAPGQTLSWRHFPDLPMVGE